MNPPQMSPHNLVQKSKRVSWLLRHGASQQGIAMDAAGWVAVRDVLRVLRLSEADLDAVVAQNDKRRFERDGQRIRASQGHSAPVVSQQALEATWNVFTGEGPVFHGTNVDAAFSIAAQGIQPQARSHVHLAPSRQSKVGKRWNVALLLVIDPHRLRAEGIPLFESPNGVLLARTVPTSAITGIEPLTRAAQAALPDLRQAFRLT